MACASGRTDEVGRFVLGLWTLAAVAVFFAFKLATHAAIFAQSVIACLDTLASGASYLGLAAILMQLSSVFRLWLPALTALSRIAFGWFSAHGPATPVALSLQAVIATGHLSTHIYLAGGALLSSVGCMFGRGGR